jgi:hypothetical protein
MGWRNEIIRNEALSTGAEAAIAKSDLLSPQEIRDAVVSAQADVLP